MKNDDALVVGALILLAMSKSNQAIQWGEGWVWPIPDVHIGPVSMRAVISQEYRSGGNSHYGVDLMYRNPAPPPTFVVPERVPAVAAKDATLWSVQRTARGWSIVLSHGRPFATFYQHLSEVDPVIADGVQGVTLHGGRDTSGVAREPLAVRAGQHLGLVGADPTDASHVRHLHFAVWYQGAGDAASIDPAAAMATWGRVQWTA